MIIKSRITDILSINDRIFKKERCDIKAFVVFQAFKHQYIIIYNPKATFMPNVIKITPNNLSIINCILK